MKQEMLDTIGVPEFYSDRLGTIEDAGNGMIRSVRCIERGGVLIPIYSCVVPAITMLRDGPIYRAMSMKVVGMAAQTH